MLEILILLTYSYSFNLCQLWEFVENQKNNVSMTIFNILITDLFNSVF